MDSDENIFQNNSEKFFNKHSIYILHYMNGDKAVASYGVTGDIDKNNIIHYCCTDSGSSGAPIINLINNKIIGIHKEGSNHFQYNKGTYLKEPINQFINKYILEQNDINMAASIVTSTTKKQDLEENIAILTKDLKDRLNEMEKKKVILNIYLKELAMQRKI
jgi:hypothetical protein